MKHKHITDQAILEQNKQSSQTIALEGQTNSQCYKHYQRVFQNAKKIAHHFEEAILTIQQLENKLSILQYKSHSFKDVFRGAEETENKRIRRKALEINRTFKCPYQSCEKLYGSESSFKQHLKLKHSNKSYANQKAP